MDDTLGDRRLPTGTVTFLRTDVEGSMGLARQLGKTWDAINEVHLGLIREAVAGAGGTVVRTEGDALFAAFPRADAAVLAAVEAQRSIAGQDWPAGASVRVRIGLHSGEAHVAGDDYGGFDVNRAARVAAAGHGGQVVLSETTAALVADDLPDGVSLRDLGAHLLRDVPRPERLHQLDIPGLPTEFPPLRADSGHSGNLPTAVTSFVGRDVELATLRALLETSRLVTLTGPGGIGKTRLATELARELAPGFPDGAWFVPLAAVDEAEAVAGTIARAIGMHDGPERPAAEALETYAARRSMLLVIDNTEQVLGAADRVAGLVAASPRSRVIVTSRAPLHVTAEQEFPVPPLGDAQAQLFLERARAVRPGWDPGCEGPVVAEICALLDGLPLGIELAAARVAMLPLPVIRDRLAARLPLPGTGPRDAPTRQRTLDDAVAWSHDLLEPRLCELLHALAVFDGGFDHDQAAAVAAAAVADPGDLLADLSELVDHSLIAPEPGAPGLRYRMLRTIQTFALARLAARGAEPAARRAHAEAFLALATEASSRFQTFEQGPWLDRLDADAENLRSAVRWSIARGAVELAQRLVFHLWRFWQMSGRLVEGRGLADRVLAMPGAEEATEARMWAAAAAGNIAYWQAEPETARRHYEEEIDLARAIGDTAGLADGYFNIAHVLYIAVRGSAESAAASDEALRLYRQIGDERSLARAEWSYAQLAMSEGRPELAEQQLLASLPRFEALGDAQYHAMTLASLAWVAFVRGDPARACRLAVDSIHASYAMRDVGTTTISLHVGVLMANIVGRADDAARLSGAFDALGEQYGVKPPFGLEHFLKIENPFATARSRVAPERWRELYEEGRRLSLDEAVELVSEIGRDPGMADAVLPTPG